MRANVAGLLQWLHFSFADEALGEALALAILTKKELELEKKPITISREYRTFVSERKTFKDVGMPISPLNNRISESWPPPGSKGR